MKILINGGLGYIGSRVYEHLLKKHDVYCVDLDLFGAAKSVGLPFFKENFKYCTEDFLQSFDVIIHLAGHSSVSSCDLNPQESNANNVLDFLDMVCKSKTKVIYASSASVYGNIGSISAKEYDCLSEPIKNYDQQKQYIDGTMCSWRQVQFYGLRFGTVCGYSLNPRNELLINSMTKSAIQDNVVKVSNPDSWRAVLGMEDLINCIEILVNKNPPIGIYNLASFNATIGSIGAMVSNIYKADYIEQKGKGTYSFAIDTSKFTDATGYQFTDTIKSICKNAEKNDFSRTRDWDIKL